MDYEDNERVARIETQVAGLSDIVGKMLGMAGNQGKQWVNVVNLCVMLRNEHIAMLRFLASSSLLPDGTSRQEFLKQIAKMETDFERIEATLAEQKNPPDISLPPET